MGQVPRFLKPERRPRRRGVIAAPIEEFRHLYLQGLSTRQIGERTGWSATYVAKLLSDVVRTRSEAARLRQPIKASQHWRTCRQQARAIVERRLGRKLTRNEHVHHIDGDYTNNADENLQVLDPRTHAHTHRPPNPVPRHLRPARRAYLKKYNAAYYQRRKQQDNGTDA